MPDGVKGWSWGAFLLHFVWGIGNRTWIALLVLVPVVNVVVVILLGLKGREWAWRNKAWRSVEHFDRVQRAWSIAALVLVAFMVLFAVGSRLVLLRVSSVYAASLQEIRMSDPGKELLGDHITGGLFVRGDIVQDPSGRVASIRYAVAGSRTKATAHVRATRLAPGRWVLESVRLRVPDGTAVVNVLRP